MTTICTEPCRTRRELWIWAIAIYLLALGVRGIVYYESRNWPLFVRPQIDEYTAFQIGLAFIDHKLPPEVFLKGPLYMWFVGAVTWIFGRDPMRVRLVQVFLTSLSPALIFLIGERIFGRRVGVLAGVLGAVFWTMVYYSLVLVDAPISTVLYLLLLCLLVRLDDARGWKWLLCGLVLGLGALSRPSILPYAPVLAILAMVFTLRRCRASDDSSGGEGAGLPGPSRAWRCAAINVMALTVGCCAAVLPVTLRNRIVGGEWVLIGAYGGQNLWIANSPRSDGKNVPIYVGDGVPKLSPVEPNDVWTSISLGNRIARYYAEQSLGRRLKFGEIDAWFGKIGREYIVKNPDQFIVKSFKRFCFFLNAHEYPNEADIYWFCEASKLIKVLSWLHFGVICPLAVMGLILASARRNWPAPLAYSVGLFLSLWLPGLCFVVNARFRIVIVPIMLPFAAYSLCQLWRQWGRQGSWGYRILSLVMLAGLAVLSNVNWFGYREKHYTDHRLSHAVACQEAGREDLLPKAVQRYEEALLDDLKTGSLTQTAVMDHAHPIGWAFFYHYRREQKEQAFQLGTLMMQHDPQPMPSLVVAYFHTAIGTWHQMEARHALDFILKNSSSLDPKWVLGCVLQMAETYKDIPSYREAAARLRDLIHQYPDDEGLKKTLKQIEVILNAVGEKPATTNSTSPATTPSSRSLPSASTLPATNP